MKQQIVFSVKIYTSDNCKKYVRQITIWKFQHRETEWEKLISVNAFLSRGLQHDWKLFLHNRLREKWENLKWKFFTYKIIIGRKNEKFCKASSCENLICFLSFFSRMCGNVFLFEKSSSWASHRHIDGNFLL